jgi:uncharacterized integral membrane protein
MRIVYATLTALFFSCILIVAYLNSARVTVTLWPDAPAYTYADIPISAVIFLSAAAGAIFACIIAVLEGFRIRLANSRLRAQIRKLHQEIESMRRPAIDPVSGSPPAPFPAAPEPSLDEEVGAV